VKPIRRADLLRLVAAALRPLNETGPDTTTIELNAGPLTKGGAAVAMKILIADDSEDNRFLVEHYLKGQPYVLRFVENGRDALNTFKLENFDLVLMDVHMPVMDGLTATELMRALERGTIRAHTPILALTADALVEDLERSRVAGCDGHLSKPVSKRRLITAIESYRFVA
jgi:two-component system, sensor histidine kinase